MAALSSKSHGPAVINGSGLTFTYRLPSRDATSCAKENLHHGEATAPSSSAEGDLWLVLAVKYSGQSSGWRSACPDRAGWSAWEEEDTEHPLLIVLQGVSPSIRAPAPAHLVLPVCKGRGLT